MIRPVMRIALVALGLAAVMYGTARMSGGWLGVPPRWATDPTDAGLILRDLRPPPTPGVMTMIPLIPSPFPGFEPCVRD